MYFRLIILQIYYTGRLPYHARRVPSHRTAKKESTLCSEKADYTSQGGSQEQILLGLQRSETLLTTQKIDVLHVAPTWQKRIRAPILKGLNLPRD